MQYSNAMDLEVLLPFHRVDSYFIEAIESLNRSKGVSFRLILIDDRIDRKINVSPILKSTKNVVLVETEGGIGYGKSLELGTNEASADVLALFNSDDLICEDRFYKQIKSLENADISITKIQRILQNGQKSMSKSGAIQISQYSPIYLLFGSYGADATWCMKREWWTKNAFFDNKECLDWRIALSSFSHSKISFIPEPLYYYRKHSMQSSSESNHDNLNMNNVYIAWKNLSSNLGIPNSNKFIFDFFATPWLNYNNEVCKDIFQWANIIREITRGTDKEIEKQINSFINRRFLIRTLNSNSNFNGKIKTFKASNFESLYVISDLMITKYLTYKDRLVKKKRYEKN
jgi:hypothetical protein